jgi:lipooligosaccharide transport system permease protein
MNSAVFLVVMAAFGAVRSAWAVVCLPAAVLTGLAFATPIEAYTMTCKKVTSFAMLFRFGIIPLFLFSGTFFPVTQLPAYVRPLAYITPLWHGVTLCRSLSLGTAQLGESALHVGYLVAVTLLGIYAGNRTYRRRLYA